MNQEIQLDQPGQVFVHDPTGGIPSTPIAVTVEAPNGAIEDATLGEPSIDSFASTLAEDAQLGAPWLTLVEGARVSVGHRYFIGAPPHCEWVVATELRGSRVHVRHRLAHAFAAGSTVRGGRLSISVNPVWQRAQARHIELGGVGVGAFRVTWSYVIDRILTRAVDHVDLVFVPRAGIVTPEGVERRYPGWLETLPNEHVGSRGADIILEAHDLVQRDAARADVNLNNAVETRELVELRARMIAVEQEVIYGKSPPAKLDAAESRYQRRAAELWSKLHRGAPLRRTFTKTSRPDDLLFELRRWLEAGRAKNVAQWKQLAQLRDTWLPRFQSPYECFEAARLIREFITSRNLVDLREQILRELE